VLCLMAFGVGLAAQTPTPSGDFSALKHWSADELKNGEAKLLLSTATHRLRLVQVTGDEVPQSHEGASDVYYVSAGSGTILAGGEWEDQARFPTCRASGEAALSKVRRAMS
jgi:hypothetical protein